MPYKFDTEKKKVGREHDRRFKLTDLERREIKDLYNYISQRNLAKMYKVSRRLIIFIGCPEKYELSKEQRRNRVYPFNKDKHKVYIRRHRAHKKELFGVTRGA